MPARRRPPSRRLPPAPWRRAAALMLLAALLLPAPPAAAQSLGTLADRIYGPRLGTQAGSVLGVMGYGIIPDGAANSIQVDQGSSTGGGASSLSLGQIGAGFTVSESFPLYLEGFIGYARYDPRFVFSQGQYRRALPSRWNSLSVTGGIGWDFRLAENLYFRPILNIALGHAESDAALLGRYINYRTGSDIEILRKGRMNAWSLGGSAVLAYYDHKPRREIDVELRYTEMYLQSFESTVADTNGNSEARAVSLWARLRWPTGLQAFNRPLRWVVDGTNSYFLGDQREVVGYGWMVKLGAGIEFDLSDHHVGALGLYAQRVRLLGRYMFGENRVRGVSVGLGITF